MHATVSAPVAIHTFQELRNTARTYGPKRVGVVVADDEVALLAASAAANLGIAAITLIGDEKKIRQRAGNLNLHELLAVARFVEAASTSEAANLATGLARDGKVDVLLKGHLRTDELLRAVLDKQAGLRA